MRVLFVIIFLSCCVAIAAFFSKTLQSNVEPRDRVESGRSLTIDRTANNLFWFVQVSDLHISRFHDFDRAPDLIQFCDSHLSVIKPELVLASGDLTDAKFRNLRGSKQFLDEWKKYYDVVQHCRKNVKTWLDLRGNHDAFDTPDWNHSSNLFRGYSAQGRKHPTSYIHHHVTPYGKYTFVAVDASPNPGPKRPFNFFGYLKQDGEERLDRYLNESHGSNMTLAFGHYPTSLIATQSGRSVRHILRNVTAYLCGHLHTMGGFVKRMYARHRSGMLELELGDWKDQRIYRVLAVDHDMLSLTDEVMGHWPVVLVTNPKHASLISPEHEPLTRILNSTHIRILVFTPGTVNNIEVYIDGIHTGKAANSEGPLFVLTWKPSKYKTGVHSIKVVVRDSLGNHRTMEQPFSLDGSSPILPFRGRFILMFDWATVAQAIFLFLSVVYCSVLVLLRRCNNIKAHLFTTTFPVIKLIGQFYNKWLYRVWLVSRTPRLCSTLIGFTLYVALGPWFVGEILEGHTGVVFVWGMYVNGSYLPVCLTYVYAILQVITFNVPMLMYVGYVLQYSQIQPNKQTWFHAARHIYIPYIAIAGLQLYVAVSEFPAAYGTRAFILGPVRTGSVILSYYLFYIARNTDVSHMLNAHHS